MTTRREGTVTCDDRDLALTLVAPAVPSGSAVLFVHGLGSSRSTNIERAEAVCQAHAATCLAFDLGGHGDSSGRLTEVTPRQNLADVVCAYDHLVSMPGIDPERIGVCAASYGAYLAVLLTAFRPVDRLLLRAPALYADDCFDRALGQRRFGDSQTAPTPLAHLALFRGPITVVESEHDEVIGQEVIGAYLDAVPGAVHVVQPGARHALTDPAWRRDYQHVVVESFASL